MDKGTRVRVVGGRKHKDKVGTVFWEGPDQYKEGSTRLGLRADDGTTVWVSADYVEALDPSDEAYEPPEPVDPPERGTRVRWENAGEEGTGTVFWVGENKSGVGFRVGIEDDASAEAVWVDARQTEPLDDTTPEMPDDDDDIPF